jgi:glycosyltransferase involved in cell wall biosynthesis
MPKVDIIIPTYNRLKFLNNCLRSVFYKTKVDYRLFIIDDCSDDGTAEWLAHQNHPNLEMVILNKKRRGLTFNFDILWDTIQGMNWFYQNESEYLCLLQDDTEIMEEGWLELLVANYENYIVNDYRHFEVGFFSGHNAPEHPTLAKFDYGSYEVLIKESARATNLVAPWSFWKSIGKITNKQPNGTDRGFPSASLDNKKRGRGSNFDLWYTGYQSKGVKVDLGRTTIKSSGYRGYVCIVIPKLVKHKAIKDIDSTWGNRNIENE